MKLFNGLAGLLSAFFAYSIAKKLDLKFAWMTIGRYETPLNQSKKIFLIFAN